MLDRRGFVAGMASLAVGASGCVHGSSEDDGNSDEERSETVPEASEAEGARFSLYITADERHIVATEEYVEPNSVSKETGLGGGYRVEFELTDGGVRALEKVVNQLNERENGSLTVEYDGEEVFDGPIAPSLWGDLRSGEYSEGRGKLSVTGLDEEKPDELVRVLSEP